MNKIQKITKGKRDFFSPKGRQVDDLALDRIKSILADLEIRRDLLIEALHKVQDSYRYISAEDMAALADIFKLSQAEVFEVGSFYHHFKIVKEDGKIPNKSKLRIYDGLSCELAGAHKLFELVKDELSDEKIEIDKFPCIGRCASAPAARFNNLPVDNMNLEKVKEINRGGMSYVLQLPQYENLNDCVSRGGYRTLNKLKKRELKSENLIKLIPDSKLRGFGGAGFPAGKKWEIVRFFE